MQSFGLRLITLQKGSLLIEVFLQLGEVSCHQHTQSIHQEIYNGFRIMVLLLTVQKGLQDKSYLDHLSVVSLNLFGLSFHLQHFFEALAF